MACPLLFRVGDSLKGGTVILHLSFEELRAIASAGELIVAAEAGGAGVAAPPDWAASVEDLLPRLTGDVSIGTLEDQRHVRDTVGGIVTEMHRRLDVQIIETHPGHEEAVALYFDYAHARTVLDRLDRMGTEMEAIADLIAGRDPAGRGALNFPD
jgi:hypothetical protein